MAGQFPEWRDPEPQPNDGYGRVPWRVLDVAIATAVIFAVFLVMMVVVGLVLRSLDADERILLTPWLFGVFEGLMVVAVWFFGIRKYRVSWRVLGLRSTSGRWALLLPWATLVASLVFTGLYTFVVTQLGIDFLIPDQDITSDVLGEGVTRALNTLVIGIWGPFAEEVFFRGFLLAALIAPLGALRAVILSSAVFAVAHLSIGTLIPIFITGMLLGWLYLRTKSLWPPVVAHMAQNILVLSVAPSV